MEGWFTRKDDKKEKADEREQLKAKREKRDAELIRDSKYTSSTMKKLSEYLLTPRIRNENQDFDTIFHVLQLADAQMSKLSDETKKMVKQMRASDYLSKYAGNMEEAAEHAVHNARELIKRIRKDLGAK